MKINSLEGFLVLWPWLFLRSSSWQAFYHPSSKRTRPSDISVNQSLSNYLEDKKKIMK